MKLDGFGVARRVALVAAVAWTLGWVAYGMFDKPFVELHYSVDAPGATPGFVLVCPVGRDDLWRRLTTASGTDVIATLCFKAQRSSSGRLLIPYRTPEDPTVRLASTMSDEVTMYANRAIDQFRLPESAESDLAHARSVATRQKWKTVGAALLGGLVALQLLWWVGASLARRIFDGPGARAEPGAA